MRQRRVMAVPLAIGVSLVVLTGCPWPGATTKPNTTATNDFAAPPAGEGIQLHVGPFDVAKGTEVQKNFYLKLPSDQNVEIKKIEFHYSPGSHHCNVFKSDTEDVPDHVEDTFNAIAYETYDMWAASQDHGGTIDFPAGYTLPMKAHQQLLIQTHYVNGSTQQTPGQGDVKINVWFAKPGQSTGHVGMLFAINKTLDIPPHTHDYVATKSITFGADKFPGGTNLFAMTGHFHSRGKKFEVYHYNGGVKSGDPIYQSLNWAEPPYKTYDTPIHINAGDKFLYECTFDNDSDATVSFGPRVETQEHANAFMYFYPGPADGHAFYDVNGAP